MKNHNVCAGSSWTLAVDFARGTVTGDDGERQWPSGSRSIIPGDTTLGQIAWEADQIVIDRSGSASGDLYYREHAGTIEISDSLAALCPRPTIQDVAVPVLLGMCMGVRPAPSQTHLQGIRRLPCLSSARLAKDGSSIRCAPSLLRGVATQARAGGDQAEAALRASLADVPAEPVVAASGGLASQTLLNLLDGLGHRPARTVFHQSPPSVIMAGPTETVTWTLDELFDSQPTVGCWPALSDRHLPTLAALAVAGLTGASTVVAGHHMRVLLGTAPEECRSAVRTLDRLTTERLDDHRPWRPWRKETHDHVEASQATVEPPPWMTPDAQRDLYERSLASRAAWSDWARDLQPRSARVLWALTDPSLACLADESRNRGVALRLPAVQPATLRALLSLPVRQRGAVEDGRFVDMPSLRRLGTGARHYAEGAHRRRTAAAAWLKAAGPAIRAAAHDGFLARAGVLDPEGVEQVLTNPFLGAEHGLVLRQTMEVDTWLASLASAS